jgi:hypothetical protein
MAHVHGDPVSTPPADTGTADAVTVAERRAAFARLAPGHAHLVKALSDEALAVEAAPNLFGRLRTTSLLLAKADGAESALEGSRYRKAADEVLTAPAQPPLTTGEQAERQRLLARARRRGRGQGDGRHCRG